MSKTAAITVFLAVLASACSTPQAPTYNYLPAYNQEVDRAWSFFQTSNYLLATQSFRKAIDIDLDASQAEAYIGLGWSLAMQDSLTSAINNFQLSLARNPESPVPRIYALSGLSFCYRDITPPNNQGVRDNALAALALDSTFVFEYKRSINTDDLKAVLAEAYFNLQDYTNAAAIADPAGTLDPAAQNYLEQLLDKINQLINLSLEGG